MGVGTRVLDTGVSTRVLEYTPSPAEASERILCCPCGACGSAW